jgi:hypothetical protein
MTWPKPTLPGIAALVVVTVVTELASSCSSPSWTLESDSGASRTGLFTLASGQNNPGALVSDGTSVYWVNEGSPPDYTDGSVVKVLVEGGQPVTLAAAQQGPAALAVDARSVYWVAGGSTHGAVLKTSLDGGKVSTLASGQSSPRGIVVDASSVYWTNQYDGVYADDDTCKGATGSPVDLRGTFLGGTVMKVALNGGTPTTLANEQCAPTGIAVDATRVYWTNEDYCGVSTITPACPDQPLGSAGNPDTPNAGNTVMSVPLDGGAVITVASNQGGPLPIGLNGATVCWTSPDDLAVLAAPVGGGEPVTLASNQFYPWGVAVDATNAYWVTLGKTSDDGTVMTAPLDGSASPVALAAGQSASYVAVDGKGVYWTNQSTTVSGGTVMKLTPK